MEEQNFANLAGWHTHLIPSIREGSERIRPKKLAKMIGPTRTCVAARNFYARSVRRGRHYVHALDLSALTNEHEIRNRK
jgi:hypothetical protein